MFALKAAGKTCGIYVILNVFTSFLGVGGRILRLFELAETRVF